MRIILGELKKIWNLRVIGILALLCVMFYVAFLRFYVVQYPNNHHSAAELAYAVMLVEKHGNTLEPEYLEELRQAYDELVREADSFIAENPRLAEIGIYDYADLIQANETLSLNYDNLTEQELYVFETLHNEFYSIPYSALPKSTKITANSPENNSIANNLQALDGILSRYETVLDPSVLLTRSAVPDMPGTDAVHARWADAVSSGEYKSVIPNEPIRYTVDYTKNLALLIVIATLFLLSPLLTTDRIRKVHLLQYTAYDGRRILGKQLTAVLISSIALTSTMALGFGAVYAANGTQFFWHSYVSSFNSFFGTAIPLTFGQYILVLLGLLYLSGLGAALLAFILSRFCGNYIALVAGLIPSAIALGFLCTYVLYEQPLFYFFNETGIVLFEPLICLVVIAAALIAAISILHRERKVDVA